MTEYPDNPGPLPAEKLGNAGDSEEAMGALGNASAGKMYYTGDDREELVTTLQTMLRDLLYDIGDTGPGGDGVDGIFGGKTENAAMQFQQENKDWDGNPLDPDGLVGPRTADALNRKMVGVWYDRHMTPKDLTVEFALATATSEALNIGISTDVSGMSRSKLIICGPIVVDDRSVLLGLQPPFNNPIPGDAFMRIESADGTVKDMPLAEGEDRGDGLLYYKVGGIKKGVLYKATLMAGNKEPRKVFENVELYRYVRDKGSRLPALPPPILDHDWIVVDELMIDGEETTSSEVETTSEEKMSTLKKSEP